jgi:hypothetical protein
VGHARKRPVQAVKLEMGLSAKFVMPGLVPGIHVLAAPQQEDVDGRDKPGHDEKFSGV